MTNRYTRASYLFEAEEREQTIASTALRSARVSGESIIPNEQQKAGDNHALDRLKELDESVQENIVATHYVLNDAKNMAKNMAINDEELARVNSLIDGDSSAENSDNIIEGEVL
jgi:hypothetical protein